MANATERRVTGLLRSCSLRNVGAGSGVVGL